jgi:hypothetical protein
MAAKTRRVTVLALECLSDKRHDISPPGMPEESDFRPIRNTFGIEINSKVPEWGARLDEARDILKRVERGLDASIDTSSWDVRWSLRSRSLREDEPMPRDERYERVRAGPVGLLLIVN